MVGDCNENDCTRLPNAADVEPHRQQADSELASTLLSMVGWGMISAVAAQHLAQCAINDGADRASLRSLASIGANGGAPGNCRRDLVRQFAGGYQAATPLVYRVQHFGQAPEGGTNPTSCVEFDRPS